MFTVAAVGAVVWVAREAMRRWVDGPEVPQVAGSWRTEQGPSGERSPGEPRAGGGSEGAVPAAGAPSNVPAGATAGGTAAAPSGAPSRAPAGKTAPRAKAAPAKSTPEKKASPAKAAPAKAAKAAKKSARRADPAEPSGPPAWVPPNGSGEAPETHPVKAKLLNRLYRVPGMPMYNRMVADRCYPDPESAEADGFKRAAR